jgi:hypothetical protein
MLGLQFYGGPGMMTQGRSFFVRPSTGSDSNHGERPDRAVATLAKALSLAVAGQNDTIYFYAESTAPGSALTAAGCTDYQAANLNWNKDLVHLIGVNACSFMEQRSRVAFASTFNSAAELFTLSASGCLIANMEFFMGVAGTSPLGCMTVSGLRNRLINCNISGFGGATHANDIASAYSLTLNGAQANTFDDCVIGLNTILLGNNINAQIYASGAATRNLFRRCRVYTWSSHATNNQFLRIGTAGIDRFLEFEDTLFHAFALGGGTGLTEGMTVTSDCGGDVILSGRTSFVNCTYPNASAAGRVFVTGPAPTAATSALAVATTH